MSVLLAALMLASAATMLSCGENEVNKESNTANNTTNVTSTTDTDSTETEAELTDLERRQLIPDDLPDTKFDGDELRFLTPTLANGYDYEKEIFVEELTGDACNDSVYNRNVKIEDRFDTKILSTAQSDPHNAIKTFVQAGTDDYHVVSFYDYCAYYPINAGVLINWLEAPYVNVDKPWHNKAANDGATINNRLYAICSDLSISSMSFTHAIFANLDMATDYGYDSETLYNIVKEGKWTIDNFADIISQMYVDANGNGKADLNDTYGFGYQITNPADVWLTAMGERVVTVTPDGKSIELTFMSEKLISAYEKIYNLHYNNVGFEKLSTQYDEEKYFAEQKLVFAPMRFAAAYNQLRDMEAKYSMLPYPKYDENQEGYYTNADDKFTVFGLPLTSSAKIDFISTIYEALCAESYKTVYPEYYDTALKGKYSTDAETAEMVELIMAGRAFEFSFQFGESYFQRLPYFIRERINDQTDITSKYKAVEKALKKGLEKKFAEIYDITVDLG